ncbi:MAG: 50S ribosomal protein L11 methyltransferase [Firmicutes bacterium]|nr:50S ribosomal protein L11 methyltransferase [Bacillota bacterium]
MNWLEIFVETSKDGIEPVSGILYGSGITGLVIKDEDDFAEFLQNKNREWDYVEDGLSEKMTGFGVTFYLRDNPAGREDFALIKERFAALKRNEPFDVGSLRLDIKNIKEEDWENNWKKYFKPFDVGSRLVVKPTWENYDNSEGKVILEIDPGNVFGSGSHETTKMCLEALDEYIKGGEKILDIGCGSGILSVGGLLLGADHAELIDIDKNAAAAADANMKLNKIPAEKYNSAFGDILEDREFDASYQGKNFDCVVANIVADIIIALSEMVPKYLKNGGIFISSGIIYEREEDVRESLIANGFQIVEMKEMGNWRAFVTRFSLEE